MNEFQFLNWQFEQLDKYKLVDGRFTVVKNPHDLSYTLMFDFWIHNRQYRQSVVLDILAVDSPLTLKLTCENFAKHLEVAVKRELG